MPRPLVRANSTCAFALLLSLAGGGVVTAVQQTPPPLQEAVKRETDADPDRGRCDYPAKTEASRGMPVRRNQENTFVFNHERLKAEDDSPYVLKADDGGFFQVLFKCTAPQFFTYTITGDPAAQPDSAQGATLPESVRVKVHLTTRGITMRHDSRFLRYHVTARLREGLRQPTGQAEPITPTAGQGRTPATPPLTGPPGTGGSPAAEREEVELFSVAFDIWVITKPEWKLGVIGGVAASSLVDARYFIKTGQDGAKTFESDSPDRVHTDVMALANAYYTQTYGRFLNVGLAFGIGTSGTASRFFIGPSFVLGKFFVLSPGVAVGSVLRAPIGQAIGQPPINGDNTLNSLSSRTMVRPYLGIGFTWIDRSDQFAAALSSAASASGVVGSCVTSVTPEKIALGEDGKPDSPITVKAGGDCLWAATLQRGGNGIDVKGGSQKGNGTVTIQGPPAGKNELSDVLNVIGPLGSVAKPVQIAQAPKSCVTAISTAADGAGIKEFPFDRTVAVKTLYVKTEENCQWTATVGPAGTAFKVEPATFAGSGPVKITPPEAGTQEITATLTVTGPAGSAPKIVSLKQPQKAGID